MDGEIVEAVTEWESEPLSGGIDELRRLQAREFTGAVTGGRAWLFMLNGRIVGVFDGSIESFENTDGTVYTAPDPSLPLLYAMQETGGETKARYYTNDTALSAADAKLSSGKFTGYIELSENVLSGDYYAIYYGGRRLACAFVGTGQQKQVLTGDEAFEAADDEVGIYEVVDVDVDVVDIPDPEPEADPDTPTAGASADGDPAPKTVADDQSGAGSDSPDGITFGGAGSAAAGETGETGETGAADDSDDRPAPEAADGPGPADSSTRRDRSGGTDPEATADATADAPAPDEASGAVPEETSASADQETGSQSTGAANDDADGDSDAADPEQTSRTRPSRTGGGDESPTDAATSEAQATDENGDPFSAEEQWRETRSIPSLDPSETVTPESGAATNGSGSRSRQARRDRRGREGGRRDAPGTGSSTGESERQSASDAGASGSTRGGDGGRADTDDAPAAETPAADEELATVRAERDRAREAVREARDRLDASEGDLTRLRQENDRLAERVEELESALAKTREELDEARAQDAAGGEEVAGDTPARTVPADRALAGTNLFVRYETKGGATLSKAHAGGATRSDVNENLRLEVHTDFESADAGVDGRPFREYLRDTIEYGFVEWVVRELLYEIQSTGNESALRDLFDAIPDIDRAELNGTVRLDADDGAGDEHDFDVVLRDRMGNPLLVADVTEGRDATTESMLDGLVGDASAVSGADEHLAAGFYVTASFFEPGALEAAADATGGGLLSRGKRKSFVKLSRKRGFHLCLVESREGEFHVNVPEL